MSSTTSEAQAAELVVVDPRLEQAIAQSGLEQQSAQGLLERFKPLFSQANRLCAEAREVSVTDATQVSQIKAARRVRLALRAVRIEAEKMRKTLKEDSLRRGKAIDGVYNVFEYVVAPIEAKMLEAEEFAERAEAARKSALEASRRELLTPFGVDVTFYKLGELSEAAFAQLLEGSRLAHENKIAAEKRAEEERIAKQKAEAEERERIRQENERLKREAAEREAAAKIEREKLAAAARAEREKAEAERRAVEEQARKEREAAAKAQREAEEKAAKERAAREKAEAEIARQKKLAEEQARKEENARRAAAAAPDREKILALAQSVRALPVPSMASAEGAAASRLIAEQIEGLAKWLENKAAGLAVAA